MSRDRLAPRPLAVLAVAATLLTCLAGAAGSASGAPGEPRIVGGQVAPAGAYPWMVALIARGAEPDVGQGCGATLIGPETVMTAAHCIGGLTPDTVDALIGRDRLTNADAGERIQIERYALEPNGIDVALLDLAKPVGVTPVGLATPADSALYAPGVPATTIGWGATTENADAGSDDLRDVEVPIVSDKDCRAAYRGSGGIDPSTQICAGVKGRDSCQGDSGGPLIVRDGAGAPLQVGVVSFGRGCGRARFPGVYTEVPAVLDFVRDPDPIWAPRPNERLARINGEPKVGEKLTCARGGWSGEAIEFDYFWSGFFGELLSQKRRYTPGKRLAGERIACSVIGFNPGGVLELVSRPVRIHGSGE